MAGIRTCPLALALACHVWLLACSASEPAEAEQTPEPAVSSRVDEAGPGRWKEFRTHRFDASLDPQQREAIARLEAIGYASGSREGPAGAGATLHDSVRSQHGPGLYTSGHAPEARLVAMDGSLLHLWRRDFDDVWPDYPGKLNQSSTAYWRRVHLLRNGHLLAIFEGLGLLELAPDSEIVWAQPNRAHHDLDVLANGDIYVLTREAHVMPRLHPREPILEDFISVLDAGGNERRRVSLIAALEKSAYADLAGHSSKKKGDIFHTNSIEVLRFDEPAAGPAFRAGNVLVSMRELDAIAIVDMQREEVTWAMRGSFRSQHDPRLLPGGKILLFDNSGLGARSRALEIDPASARDGWTYSGDSGEYLYSKWCGTVQRLKNGNTLITESDNGRALEVTRDGISVWEFQSPHRAGTDDRFVATLFEFERLPSDFPITWASGVDAPR